jgi:hypothetical protein
MEMKTLLPKAWLAGSVLDFTLLEYWLSIGEEAQMYYISLDFSKSLELPVPEQVNQYRKWSPIRPSANGVYAYQPVVFLTHSMDHYFAVVFDYQKLTAYVFGSKSRTGLLKGQALWKSWGGSELWSNFALYHGWELSDPNTVTVYARQWPQVFSNKSYMDLLLIVFLSERY